jgi:uncharacterized protein affecting Mg2+/Co2+ transport
MDLIDPSLLLWILERVDPASLCNFAETAKRYFRIANSSCLWQRTFEDLELEPRDNCYTTVYREFAEKYQDYVSVYVKVLKWRRELNATIEHFPLKYLTSNVPAIRQIEQFRHKLFKDHWNSSIASYLLLHHFVNGQLTSRPTAQTGFFGGMMIYDYYVNLCWLPIQEVRDGWFAKDSHGTGLKIDESGNVRYSNWKNPVKYLDFGPFDEYLDRYLTELLENKRTLLQHVPVIHNRIPLFMPLISLFPISGQYYSEFITVSGSLRFKVAVSSLPFLQSNSDAIVHAYGISMELLASEFPLQLMARHWQICTSAGIERVSGPGVIGEYPRFRAPGDSFFYTSFCPQSDEGIPLWMEGTFQFNMNSRLIDIVVPRFRFAELISMH